MRSTALYFGLFLLLLSGCSPEEEVTPSSNTALPPPFDPSTFPSEISIFYIDEVGDTSLRESRIFNYVFDQDNRVSTVDIEGMYTFPFTAQILFTYDSNTVMKRFYENGSNTWSQRVVLHYNAGLQVVKREEVNRLFSPFGPANRNTDCTISAGKLQTMTTEYFSDPQMQQVTSTDTKIISWDDDRAFEETMGSRRFHPNNRASQPWFYRLVIGNNWMDKGMHWGYELAYHDHHYLSSHELEMANQFDNQGRITHGILYNYHTSPAGEYHYVVTY